MSNGGDCRTAPATPGLLKREEHHIWLKAHRVWSEESLYAVLLFGILRVHFIFLLSQFGIYLRTLSQTGSVRRCEIWKY